MYVTHIGFIVLYGEFTQITENHVEEIVLVPKTRGVGWLNMFKRRQLEMTILVYYLFFISQSLQKSEPFFRSELTTQLLVIFFLCNLDTHLVSY